MIDEHTDLSWVADGLPGVAATELHGPDAARRELLAHIATAGASPRARTDRHGPRGRRDAPTRRRALQLGSAGVAAAAAAFAVVNVTSGGHAGTVSEAQAKQIVARASATASPAAGQVLAYTIVDTDGTVEQTAENGSTPQDWAIRSTAADGAPKPADGQEGGRREFYDPATDTIYRESGGSMTVGLVPDDSALVGGMSASGAKLTVDKGVTTSDGRAATKVTSIEADGEVYELWVDPQVHDRPLQFVWKRPSAPTQTTVWRDYRMVTPGAGTPSPARLSDAYPSATVRTLDDAAFRTAYRRAGLG